jgi:hypothetical protein
MQNVQRRQRIRYQVTRGERDAVRLAGIAQHSTMKDVLAQAERDLDEAMAFLDADELRIDELRSAKPRGPDDESRGLQFVESLVLQAQLRLKVAEERLTRRGPNAMLLRLT